VVLLVNCFAIELFKEIWAKHPNKTGFARAALI